MTYLAEETEARGLGLAMGIYVGATAVGGMGGRVITVSSPRPSTGAPPSAPSASSASRTPLGFLLLLPASRHFRARAVDLRSQARAFGAALADVAAPARLRLSRSWRWAASWRSTITRASAWKRRPIGLDQAQEGLIFTLYLLGTVSSTLAGTLADRLGRAPVMALARRGGALRRRGHAVRAALGDGSRHRSRDARLLRRPWGRQRHGRRFRGPPTRRRPPRSTCSAIMRDRASSAQSAATSGPRTLDGVAGFVAALFAARSCCPSCWRSRSGHGLSLPAG